MPFSRIERPCEVRLHNRIRSGPACLPYVPTDARDGLCLSEPLFLIFSVASPH